MSENKKIKKTVSLIPGAGIQFWDCAFDANSVPKIKREYFEVELESQGEDELGPQGQDAKHLMTCLEMDEEGAWIDLAKREPAGNLPKDGEYLTITIVKALEPFVKQWVPIPMFRIDSVPDSGVPNFLRGPTNWCRARLVQSPETDTSGNTHELTIAFDMYVAKKIPEFDREYASLNEEDVEYERGFMFAWDVFDNAWYLQTEWVDNWIEQLFLEFKNQGRDPKKKKITTNDLGFKNEDIARYLTFLQVLSEAEVIPRVRLVNFKQYDPINVDLVLDIGNSRSCGLLIEDSEEDTIDISRSSVLELRDLTDPEIKYAEPFSSNISFAEARFGDLENYSRGSGRNAFEWHSLVRLGKEAAKVSFRSRREAGQNSMSSPKRYLWDQDKTKQVWRFCPDSESEFAKERPVAEGKFVSKLNEVGTPLEALQGKLLRDPIFRNQSNEPLFDALFSRSSLMMFLMAEVVLHALVNINSPQLRYDRVHSDRPRRLRNIILTMPPAMQIAERNIFSRRAKWAIDTLWDSLDWNDLESRDFRIKPDIQSDIDEASATQMVYLYNEVNQKYAGDVTNYFQMKGRERDGYSSPNTLRVASIDIGGGTTDLIITTYIDGTLGPTGNIIPRQEFREGFKTAGDDILKKIIENHFIPYLCQAIEDSGGQNARELIEKKLEDKGISEPEKRLRQQFSSQVAVPFGLYIISLSERSAELDIDDSDRTISFDNVFKNFPEPHPEVLAYIEDEAKHQGAADFSLSDLNYDLDFGADGSNSTSVDSTVIETMKQTLDSLCELVFSYQCDVLLLSGRPSCLPGVQKAVVNNAPVALDRFIPLNKYKVGNWYPLSRNDGRIVDPKSTTSVGALVCVLSEGRVRNFKFEADKLKPESTARFIGPTNQEGQIRSTDLLFNGADMVKNREEELTDNMPYLAPHFIGFRQLPLDRWLAEPFYYICFSSSEAEKNSKGLTPYNVSFEYRRKFKDDDELVHGSMDGFDDEGSFEIDTIEDKEGNPVNKSDLKLQFKTLVHNNHWVDSGEFDVQSV